jgi:8-oxo-dGTP pyrophosphatase MutT (NUDIX family)
MTQIEGGEVPGDAIKREVMEETELEVPLQLWRVPERPGPHATTRVQQYVYTGETDRKVSSLAVNEGQALRYVGPKELAGLPVIYGFDALLGEHFASQEAAA